MLSRIAEAKLAVADDFKEIASKGDGQTEAKAASAEPKAEAKQDRVGGHEIIHLVSEYLFDLWDANCMDAYHKVSEFEERAARQFDPDVEEYTFEQEALHKEFCVLFEELTEGYIKENGYTLEQFYEEARVLVEEREKLEREGKRVERDPWQDPPDPKEEADEVVEVIHQVASFQAWAEAMRERAR